MKNTFEEFKKFIMRGNIFDMAVGVIIGGAFGNIVTSLVNDIIMPLVGVIMGGIDFTSLSIKIGESQIMYGNFIQAIINFLIIATCIFSVTKAMAAFVKKKEEEPAPEPKKDPQVELLEEIRDLLKNK
ncbi:MAG: large-conductance mechanosensitive channel protein MscL [Holdemanella sp.]|nr:large-conductance mechanosensitive channel protein MscL [Holdemanella sp.]